MPPDDFESFHGWASSRFDPEPDLAGFTAEADVASAVTRRGLHLNEDQQKAFDDLAPRVRRGGFGVDLLFEGDGQRQD